MSADREGRQPDSGAGVYRRLLSYAWPYRGRFLLAVVSMAVTSGTETGFAWLMKPLINSGFVKSDPHSIRYIPPLIVGIFLARGLFGFLANYVMTWIGRTIIFHLRNSMFSRLVHLPSRFYDNNSSSLLISKVIYDVEQVMSATTKAVSSVVKDSLSLIGLIGLMIYYSWRLTLIMLLVAPVISFAVTKISRRFRKSSHLIQQSMGEITHAVQEAIDGQRVVKTFCAQDREIAAFGQVNGRNQRYVMKKATTSALNVPVIELLSAIGIAIAIYAAIQEAAAHLMNAGTFVSYITAMMLMMPALKRLTQVNETVQTGVAAAGSVFAMVDEEPEPDPGVRTLPEVRGEVEYRQVSFSYPGSPALVLDQVSLRIEPGTTLALVGASGSGKTTTANLLARFYPADSGEILLDGVNINELRLANLRHHIALVSQDTVLFDDSIRNNIAYGSSGEIDPARIEGAARAAHVLEFAQRMPEGLDTVVGERGVRLSGGQRQRIAIARALYKNAPVLILDEATSALDTESERLVHDAMQQLMRNRTTLVIAHRLSTIENADRIVVLEGGRVMEAGSHRELLARNGIYARLYRIQFNEPRH
ncbi:MAG: lipid A export permease/ATP-binding protein MsbA [Gammaproteobacteria bacterium]|nr:lipid A export permease/ATP-binding protein MsbA [Gammaproteobacteria bacterium]